jgi:hypothetical protein
MRGAVRPALTLAATGRTPAFAARLTNSTGQLGTRQFTLTSQP